MLIFPRFLLQFFLLVFLLCGAAKKKAKYVNSVNNAYEDNNLLFIMFDDLRPDLNCYGQSHMITPNFDRLAKKSVVYDHAYAQISVCNPSRDSILTGLRPDTVGQLVDRSELSPYL